MMEQRSISQNRKRLGLKMHNSKSSSRDHSAIDGKVTLSESFGTMQIAQEHRRIIDSSKQNILFENATAREL